VSQFADGFPGNAREVTFAQSLDTLLLNQSFLMTMAGLHYRWTTAELRAEAVLWRWADFVAAVLNGVFGGASGSSAMSGAAGDIAGRLRGKQRCRDPADGDLEPGLAVPAMIWLISRAP
jgi:hypothetical protein